jgi:hypothetical protein
LEAFFHPGDDFGTAVGVEVDVDVGHAFSAAVEEAFEEQSMRQWID